MKSINISQDESAIVNNYCLKINESFTSKNICKFVMIFLFLFLIIFQTKLIYDLKVISKHLNENKIDKIKYDLNFKYHLYEREMITEKMKKYAGWLLRDNEPYFINGIIRKFKPRKCLEIGVAKGGSSIIILNALKGIKDSFLVSLNLNYNTLNKKIM